MPIGSEIFVDLVVLCVTQQADGQTTFPLVEFVAIRCDAGVITLPDTRVFWEMS